MRMASAASLCLSGVSISEFDESHLIILFDSKSPQVDDANCRWANISHNLFETSLHASACLTVYRKRLAYASGTIRVYKLRPNP